jgi:hypothetical protein
VYGDHVSGLFIHLQIESSAQFIPSQEDVDEALDQPRDLPAPTDHFNHLERPQIKTSSPKITRGTSVPPQTTACSEPPSLMRNLFGWVISVPSSGASADDKHFNDLQYRFAQPTQMELQANYVTLTRELQLAKKPRAFVRQ